MEIYEEIRADREKGAERLVREYRARLNGAALMLCNDPGQADELVFRAFEQAIRKIDDFRPVGSFYYWVYTILLNLYRMDIRRRSCRPETAMGDELPERAAEASHSFNEFLFRGSAEAVRTAVSKLPPNFREVVVLRYFEEMSTAEIAKVTGLNEGTVRSRLHYAKDALYAMLSDTELSPDFTSRLVKATKPKFWLFRRATVASLALALGLVALAGGTAAVVAVAVGAGAPAEAAASASEPFRQRRAALWKVQGDGTGLFSEEADDIDRAIEKGLAFLSAQQKEDGSFPGNFGNTAAVPALVGMACLSKGHLPTDAKYGRMLLKCLDYVLTTPDLKETSQWRGYLGGSMYIHSIGTLFLAEMSGMVDDVRQRKIDKVLPLAVKVITDAQEQKKGNSAHVGGWRYQPSAGDSDLSCSGWALMALRSARLNGARLPPEAIEKAVLYIRRSACANGGFSYQPGGGAYVTLSGAGILCLELCGRHLDPESLKAADFLKNAYKQLANCSYRYYGLYYVAQGLFQLGGETWEEFSKWMYATCTPWQRPDGSWPGASGEDNPAYTTAMTILAFTVPYRMLPIYQRDETVDNEG